MKKLYSITAALIICGLLCATATAAELGKTEITEYGIYKVLADKKVPDVMVKNSTSSISRVTKTELVKKTDKIPLKKNTLFGLKYKVNGKPDGTRILVVIAVNHPPMQAPGKGKLSTSKWQETPAFGKVNFVGLKFEKDWSMKPGKYTISIYRKKKLLASKTFTVAPVK